MARAFAEVLRRWCLSGSAAVIQQPTLCLPTLPHGNGARTIDLAGCQKAMPPRGHAPTALAGQASRVG